LESLRINPEVAILGNTVSVKVSRNVSSKASFAISGFGNYTPYGEIASLTKEYYRRQCGLHLPMLPLLKPEFNSVKHAIDAAALILQPTLKQLRKSGRK
jgi:hypothetical protein